MSAKVMPCRRITFAVSSIEFCQCSFDKSDIRVGLGGGGKHSVIIIPLQKMRRARNGAYVMESSLRQFHVREQQFGSAHNRSEPAHDLPVCGLNVLGLATPVQYRPRIVDPCQ